MKDDCQDGFGLISLQVEAVIAIRRYIAHIQIEYRSICNCRYCINFCNRTIQFTVCALLNAALY